MDPFIGEIRAVSFPFAPRGWTLCNGQLLPINQNQALFALLGTQFGGNGVNNFAVPDLRGRVSVSQGSSTAGGTFTLGEAGGNETVTMTSAQLPLHTHQLMASNAPASTDSPAGAAWAVANDANGTNVNFYTEAAPNVTLAPAALSTAGASQPVSVMQPVTVVNYIMATTGLFPPRQ